jgi:hypothetical protein
MPLIYSWWKTLAWNNFRCSGYLTKYEVNNFFPLGSVNGAVSAMERNTVPVVEENSYSNQGEKHIT